MQTPKELLDHIAIVLVRPKLAENIGAAARIAWNMGINRLILVTDHPPERENMAKMATNNAVHLLDSMIIHSRLDEALAGFTTVVGTTARRGRLRFVETTPRKMATEIIPMLVDNDVALLFGPEDTGLTNDDLKFCQMASAIPTADFSSINLAQAVAIHCYELYHEIITSSRIETHIPQLATNHELESMYFFVENSLQTIDFIDNVNQLYWMANIRRLLGRLKLTSKDTNIIRGICKKFLAFQQKDAEKNGEAT
jgi:tRNA/rRNA methyltransferase